MNTFAIWADLKRRAEELAKRDTSVDEEIYRDVVRSVCQTFDPPDSVLAFYLTELRAMTEHHRQQRSRPSPRTDS